MPFPNSQRLNLAQLPTPLHLLPRVTEALNGPRIWVKRDDLTGSVLSGNKVRKLEYLLADAQAQQAQVLVTCGGVHSNHCRATALVAAQAGLQSHLILRGAAPANADGNLLLDKLAGAAVSYYSPREYQQQLPDIFNQWEEYYRKQGRKAYLIPTGGSNGVGLWGYFTAAEELHSQFDEVGIDPEFVVCASGSGGTQAGLTLGFYHLRPHLSVLAMAVCDDAGYFEHKVTADVASWAERYQPDQQPLSLNVRTIDRYIGEGYGLAQAEVLEAIAWLARTEGIVLDPVYTGKAFYGLMQEATHGELRHAKDVVFVHTGGVFGLFPYRDQLTDVLAAKG